jgi:hypothetical protein
MYGEYAPPGWVSPAQQIDPSEPVPVPASTEPQQASAPHQAGAPQTPPAPSNGDWPAMPGTGTGTAAAAPKRRTWDTALTVGLLLIGTWSVAGSVIQYANLGAVLSQVFVELGAGEFSSFETAATVGLVANIVQITLLVGAIALSLWSLTRRRLAFIYPVIAGVIAAIVLVVLMGVVIVGDPAFMEFASNPDQLP